MSIKMLSKDTNINAGDSSVNNQAQTINNTYNGITYQDARDIATDVFKNNFLILKDEAAAIAAERASEITEKFLKRLETEAPDSLNEFATPGMQDTFFNAQKEYAISGDEEVADMLVEILVERAKTPLKSRKRFVLDESLKIASKLSLNQMNLLTLTHLERRTIHQGVGNFDSLINILNQRYSLMEDLEEDQINGDLLFLEYLRLGKIVTGNFSSPEEILHNNYKAYLSKGFTLDQCKVPEVELSDLFITCFHDKEKFQFRFETKEMLEIFLRQKKITEERIHEIASHFNSNIFHQGEINFLLSTKVPHFAKLLNIYNNSQWKSFELTSVGMAIAISNYHRQFGDKLDLSVWIN
jgi:hypothetical protein